MLTTYVGSFPLDYSQENISRILRDVLEIPIECPNYPQLRDFVHQFLEPFVDAGIMSLEGKKYILKGDLSLRIDFEKPLRDAELAAKIIMRSEDLRGRVKKMKACITGPFTLSSQVYLKSGSGMESTMLSEIDLVERIADYVSLLAREMKDLGYDYIVVDEPILSVIVGARRIMLGYDPDDIIDILDRVAKRISVNKGIHVCGRLPRQLVEILTQTEFAVLDHEFASNPLNFKSVDKAILEENDKFLALGVVSSMSPQVETIDEVRRLIVKGIRQYGRERIAFVKPDCGFRGLKGRVGEDKAYDIALRKLRILRNARDLVARELNIEIDC
ncbi:MAG: hypothetical protein DRZ82_08920 [Thermoprotei archaeon]|nr:MAG: hypothetical protein DRZ82_08920 [Thermoprotei archaeon]